MKYVNNCFSFDLMHSRTLTRIDVIVRLLRRVERLCGYFLQFFLVVMSVVCNLVACEYNNCLVYQQSS